MIPSSHVSLTDGGSMSSGTHRQRGFTLIELMIVVVIAAILAAVGIPSYQSYVVKANRAAAQAFMLDVASREKQYLLDARAYAPDLATLQMTAPTDVSRNYGTITITPNAPNTPPTFSIRAHPTSAQQASDGDLTLASDGTKGPSGKW
jgi:type IV pilus assembly protein PilE